MVERNINMYTTPIYATYVVEIGETQPKNTALASFLIQTTVSSSTRCEVIVIFLRGGATRRWRVAIAGHSKGPHVYLVLTH